jgi:hypothetical protein
MSTFSPLCFGSVQIKRENVNFRPSGAEHK